ncbi:MAG: protein kinase [Ktedonobacteraceae bacterium]|nr:protein kinase [Ktedonobacteraceae bacterium]
MFADAAALIGQTIAGYRLLRILGKGGMGAVFLGQSLDDVQEQAAIKVLLPSQYVLSETRTAFQTRFMRETKVLSSLHHPHIVPILGFGKLDELSYIVMPYITGGTLSAHMKGSRNPLPFTEIMRYAAQLASALDYAHAQGIVHRDIKPGNVLLDADGNVFLSDFGIARFYDSSPDVLSTVPASLTSTGEIFGTPSYMAPELFHGEQAEPTSDVYALGVLLYQLVTGRVPFQGKGPLDVGIKHLNEAPMPARALRAELPEPAEAALIRALAKSPAERFASASELANAFNDGLEGLWPVGISVRPVRQLKTRTLADASLLGVALPKNTRKLFSFRRSWHDMRGPLVAVVLVVVLLQALVVGIMMSTHSFGSPSPLAALSTNLQKVQPLPTVHTSRPIKATPSPTVKLLSPAPSPYVAVYNPGPMHFAVSNNSVYAISNDGDTILWTYTAGAPIVQPPLIAGNTIYMVTDKGQVYALQLTNGALLWSFATHASTSSPLTIANDVVLLYTNSGAIYRFSANNGNLLGVVKPTPTPIPGITPTPQATPTPTPGVTPTPQVTPTPTPVVTPTPQDEPSPTPQSSTTATPEVSFKMS